MPEQILLVAPGRELPEPALQARLEADAARSRGLGARLVECGRAGWADPVSLRALSRALRASPSARVVTFGTPALAAALATGARRRVTAYEPEPSRGVSWMQRRFEALALRMAGRVVAGGVGQKQRLMKLGVAESRLSLRLPRAAPVLSERRAERRAELCKAWGVPANARLVATAAPLTWYDVGTAVWAFDVFRYFYPEAHLLVVGGGPERERLERYTRQVAGRDVRVRLLGPRDDWADVLGWSDMVWALGPRDGGSAALSAMANGVPLVARAQPDLDGVIEPGVTALAVPAGHELIAGVVRAARRVWDETTLADGLVEAGRERAARLADQPPLWEVG